MISRLTGALVRAVLVVILIVIPSLLLPASNADANQVVTLVAIFAALLVFIEYTTTSPGLVEFRDAPPFNRIRFLSLFATVFLLTLIYRGQYEATTLTQFVEAVGTLIGQVMDFPFSPVRLVVNILPEGTSESSINLVRSAAGMSYLISLITLAVFLIVLRLHGWPSHKNTFNVWVNLPTFDPTAGGDVVGRLTWDGRFNVALGFLLPFLTPAVVTAAAGLFDPVNLESQQTLIWTISVWAFLPASLFMRGIAMSRVATMIEDKRKSHGLPDALLPA